jgi:hypothetical protein
MKTLLSVLRWAGLLLLAVCSPGLAATWIACEEATED